MISGEVQHGILVSILTLWTNKRSLYGDCAHACCSRKISNLRSITGADQPVPAITCRGCTCHCDHIPLEAVRWRGRRGQCDGVGSFTSGSRCYGCCSSRAVYGRRREIAVAIQAVDSSLNPRRLVVDDANVRDVHMIGCKVGRATVCAVSPEIHIRSDVGESIRKRWPKLPY